MVKFILMETQTNKLEMEAKMATKGIFHISKEISKDNKNWTLAFDQYMNTHVYSDQDEIAEDMAKYGVELITMQNFLNLMQNSGNHDRMLTKGQYNRFEIYFRPTGGELQEVGIVEFGKVGA